MIVLVMGVAGSGKSTVGRALAGKMGFRFVDADDLHPPENIEKMRKGIPLDDRDRSPWLDAIRAQLHGDVVLACSALKEHHRIGINAELVIYLRVPEAELERRLSQRAGHFFGPELLRSQLEALEEPSKALVVDATQPVDSIVEQLFTKLRVAVDHRVKGA